MYALKRSLIYGFIFIISLMAFNTVLMEKPSKFDTLTIEATYETVDILQVFYSENSIFNEQDSVKKSILNPQKSTVYNIEVPKNVKYLRIDFGEVINNKIIVDSIALETFEKKYQINLLNEKFLVKGVDIKVIEEGLIGAQFTDRDSQIIMQTDDLILSMNDRSISTTKIIKCLFAGILAFLVIFFMYKFVSLKDIYSFLSDIVINRRLLKSLAINDVKVKFAGSYFGILWAFIQPICTIAVFWFVFEYGFKNSAVSEVPFALWLSAGLIPWFFFSDALNGATNTFIEYSYLVKKVVFKIEILPFVKILSSFFVHMVFVVFLCLLFMLNGVSLSFDLIGIFYYMICLGVFVMALSFVTSSIVIFFKDLTQIIGIVLQFLMWLCPIMWQPSVFPENIISVMRLNPLYYIIEGYRSCFIIGEISPTFESMVYFWIITSLMFLLGIVLFKRLKPHFADVL